MSELDQIKAEIKNINARNKRVEANKAWETSGTRKIAIASTTYIIVLLFFLMTDDKRPFISALVPTIGFLLSTASIDVLKSWWIKNRNDGPQKA